MQLYFSILVIIWSSQLHNVVGKCRPSTYSINSHYLAGHVMSTRIVSSLSECVIICVTDVHCKSLNFHSIDGLCDLNDADRRTLSKDFRPKIGCIYMEMFPSFKSCAEIQQAQPQAKNGYYWIQIGSREAQVYCDMTNYGGGWTLAVTINSAKNDHLQSAEMNCLNSKLCVPFTENDIAARKLTDKDIHELLHFEGTFRVDVLEKPVNYTIFYQIPSGPTNFKSTCSHGKCPRIIISHSFPYRWETNTCTNQTTGYRIAGSCHRVFDGHDDGECGSLWFSSQYPHTRALYGYAPCSHGGIFENKCGMLFVK
ncbi:uncharacterized protein LOC113674490 [Pocillopora damicornis]|uniref:uncharacterized protein LOC113674490 n=1 Tax=Pocillopora damicornis TaxID=46731 RepID=UPI000F554599|nr:uncharacterized protein LOC113674490 [Pocillopora damicornis]